MQNVIYEEGQDAGDIANMIFDACRANEAREQKDIDGHRILFTPIGGERHIASVIKKGSWGAEHILIGSALVDEHDC